MNRNAKVVTLALCLALVLAVSSGCGKKKKDFKVDPYEIEDDSADTSAPEVTRGEGLPNLNQEDLLFEKGNLRTIHFDYDSYALRPDALSALRDNADKIKQAPGVIIQIEGHCDERGTQEYNLALGERRALAVREHLMKLGISGDRMITISYGEEDPVDLGHSEAAWSKNRRAEFNRGR